MEFDTFLNLLIKIAIQISPDLELKQASEDMIERYFVPIYNTIMKETVAGDVFGIVNKEIESEELRAFYGVFSTLLSG